MCAGDRRNGMDIAINNARIITPGFVTDATDQDWTLSMGVNVEAPFRIWPRGYTADGVRGRGAIANTALCWDGM